MITVYVWKGHVIDSITESIKSGESRSPDLGHASMQIDDLYCSFWPEKAKPLKSLKKRQNRMPASLADEISPDQEYMQRPPDYTIELHNLGSWGAKNGWQKALAGRKKYHILSRNCSTMVGWSLYRGFILRPRKFLNLKAFWQLQAPRINDIGDSFKFSASTFTYWTPNTVLSTAEFFKRIVG